MLELLVTSQSLARADVILGGVVWGMTATSRAGGVGEPGSPASRYTRARAPARAPGIRAARAGHDFPAAGDARVEAETPGGCAAGDRAAARTWTVAARSRRGVVPET